MHDSLQKTEKKPKFATLINKPKNWQGLCGPVPAFSPN